MCWRAANAQVISILNIKEVIRNYWKYKEFEEFKEHQIDLSDFVDKTKVILGQRQAIQMDACSPLYALHAFSDESFGEEEIEKRCNAIQVSIGSRGIVYDLNPCRSGNVPVAMSEIPAMHNLLKVQNYVECGHVIQTMHSLKAQSGTWYQLARSIKSNNEGSFYFLSQD